MGSWCQNSDQTNFLTNSDHFQKKTFIGPNSDHCIAWSVPESLSQSSSTSSNITQLLIALPAYASFDSHVVDARTKQKPCCWSRNKTKAILLMWEQNKSHVVMPKQNKSHFYAVAILLFIWLLSLQNQIKMCTKLVKLLHNMIPKFWQKFVKLVTRIC